MTRRVLAISLALVLLTTPCSCSEVVLSPTPTEQVTIDPDQYADLFKTEWQYNTLSEQEKVYYGYLYTAVKEAEAQESTISISTEDGQAQTLPGVRVTLPDASLSKEGITALFEAFFRDNPQFFYLNRTYHLEGRSSSQGEDVVYDTLILEFSLPVEERKAAVAQLEQTVQSIVDSCPISLDDYERELYLHDQLGNRCTYDYQVAETPSEAFHTAYTAYGALVEGKAVCEGYAKAMQLLLKTVNIPATVISGNAIKTGEAHMWNLVKINGCDYFLDPTWNDNDQFLQHTYFNLTTQALKITHTIDDQQPALVECTETKDNYFVKNAAYIDTYERDAIAEAIARQLKAGKEVIQLQFAPGKFSNGQLFLKNRTLVLQKVAPYLAGTNLFLWEYQLWAVEEQQVLTLVKN